MRLYLIYLVGYKLITTAYDISYNDLIRNDRCIYDIAKECVGKDFSVKTTNKKMSDSKCYKKLK